LDNPGFKSHLGLEIFFFKMSRPAGHEVDHSTHLVQRLKMSGAIPALPLQGISNMKIMKDGTVTKQGQDKDIKK
jgi:hypothetical protein